MVIFGESEIVEEIFEELLEIFGEIFDDFWLIFCALIRTGRAVP